MSQGDGGRGRLTHSTISRCIQLSGKAQFPAASKKWRLILTPGSVLHTNSSLNTSYWDLQFTLHTKTHRPHFTPALTVHSDQHSHSTFTPKQSTFTSALTVHNFHKYSHYTLTTSLSPPHSTFIVGMQFLCALP